MKIVACVLFATVLSLELDVASGPGLRAPAETLVLTQSPLEPDRNARPVTGMPWADCGAGSRIVMLGPGSTTHVLSRGFHSACDPEISFDGQRMLFAARRSASDNWDIYEMELDGARTRQITRGQGNCRNPVYQGSHYTIVADRPWYQITFASDRAGEISEHAPVRSTSLYSSRLDGTDVRRLTFNPSSDMSPTILPDGRLLFSSWQRSTLERGLYGRIGLFAAQTDGIDYALFSADEGRRVKLTPCVTPDRLVVFVENDELTWDAAGNLAAVSLRRNLHSYRPITGPGDGLFCFPSPSSDGKVLVSRRPEDGSASYGVYRLDPRSGSIEAVFDDPEYHDIQARVVAARSEPDGRSSVVTDTTPNGKFYGLDVYESDLGEGWIRRGTPVRLRVLEGIPRKTSERESSPSGTEPLLQRRILGVVPVEEDGSFNFEVPANLPIQLQLLDDQGMALRSCGWIWVRNRETRGCIGCHEDGERTPDNRFVQALGRPGVPLTLPPVRRRTVDFRRDVMPILDSKCSSTACHGNPTARLALGDPSSKNVGGTRSERAYAGLLAGFSSAGSASIVGTLVHPGRARTSPLIWRLVGRNTSRPWDDRGDEATHGLTRHPGVELLTVDEKQTLVEWIDLGARWSGIPEEDPPELADPREGGAQ